MLLDIDCSGTAFKYVLYPVKNFLNLLMIICPILAIISVSVILAKMVIDPEEKKNFKKLKNSLFALIIVFFIPVLVNVLMYALGESTDISSCWNNASSSNDNNTYIPINDDSNNKSVVSDPDDYEN